MDVKMAAALDGGVGNDAEFCRRQGITRATFYKWRNRVQAEGIEGLHERSRRPHTSPGATASQVEDRVVLVRKQLADNGDYNGPESIRQQLLADARRHARPEHYNHQRPHRALHGRTPAEAFAASPTARPADRPLAAALTVRRCRTNHTGVVSIGQRQVAALGGYRKLQDVTVVRDGDHVAAYAGNKLIRAFDAEPGRTYQPLGSRPAAAR